MSARKRLLEEINDTRHIMRECTRAIDAAHRWVATNDDPPRSSSSVWLFLRLVWDLAENSAVVAMVACVVSRRRYNPEHVAGRWSPAALTRRLDTLDLALTSAALRGMPAQPRLVFRAARMAAEARLVIRLSEANDRGSAPGAALTVAWLAELWPGSARRCRSMAFLRRVTGGSVRRRYLEGLRARWRLRLRVMPARSPLTRDELTGRAAPVRETRTGRPSGDVRGTPPGRFREPKRVPKNGAVFRPHVWAPARATFASAEGAAPGTYPNLGPKKGPKSGARVRDKSASAVPRACR